jgi:hypothetical protein
MCRRIAGDTLNRWMRIAAIEIAACVITHNVGGALCAA